MDALWVSLVGGDLHQNYPQSIHNLSTFYPRSTHGKTPPPPGIEAKVAQNGNTTTDALGLSVKARLG